ncbi:unnamed protein product [Ilex paraguariensis]|uniref:EamA domain-containing protein n=1 Tax=Ilex paraguariensis TaxID=185542 RepID=A0ABC8RHG0_9AQUA
MARSWFNFLRISSDAFTTVQVILYRSGLVTAGSSFVIAASIAFLPDDSLLHDLIKQNLDLFYALGAGGLGLSLYLIHIYVTEIKRTLQALWALGVLGSVATYMILAQPAHEDLIQYVLENPTAVWFVGPLFAALTGLVFKEGLCYGKFEAGLLTFVIPSVLLGHLVILYRSGLVTAGSSFVIAASIAFLPDDSLLHDLIKQNLDLFYALGAGGLGLSLYLIHIYVTEIKRTLQALWALGVLGSVATYMILAQPAHEDLIQYVLENPTAVWFVGPLFAALTGLVFKEGLCYGKFEAGLLTFVIPSVLLGHLTGLMDDGVKVTLLGVWMALFLIFAGRKFTQPIKVVYKEQYHLLLHILLPICWPSQT